MKRPPRARATVARRPQAESPQARARGICAQLRTELSATAVALLDGDGQLIAQAGEPSEAWAQRLSQLGATELGILDEHGELWRPLSKGRSLYLGTVLDALLLVELPAPERKTQARLAAVLVEARTHLAYLSQGPVARRPKH